MSALFGGGGFGLPAAVGFFELFLEVGEALFEGVDFLHELVELLGDIGVGGVGGDGEGHGLTFFTGRDGPDVALGGDAGEPALVGEGGRLGVVGECGLEGLVDSFAVFVGEVLDVLE